MNLDMNRIRQGLKPLAPALITAAIVLAAFLALKYLLPFVMALMVAAMVWPLVCWLERFKINRMLSSVLCLSALYIAGGTLATLMIVRTSQELLGLAGEIPAILADADQLFGHLISRAEEAYLFIPAQLAPYADQAVTQLGAKVVLVAQEAAAWLISGLSKMPGILLVLIFSILSSYIITLNLPGLGDRIAASLNHTAQHQVRTVLREMAQAFGKYLKATGILVGITFGVTLAGMLLIGVDYALVGSFVIAVADLLPLLGPGSIFIPWILWLVFTGEMTKGLMMLALYGFIFVFRQAIQPKILADSMELPALPLLIAIWIGLTQFGLAGLLLAPFVLVLYQAVARALNGPAAPKRPPDSATARQ